jgi:hypothetical protein
MPPGCCCLISAASFRLAASTENTHLLELFQLQAQEGPCLDCFHTSRPISVTDLNDTTIWPRFVDEVVDFVSAQVGIDRSELGFYDWSGRTIKAHRTQIRAHFGFRECSVTDAEVLAESDGPAWTTSPSR